ncbi:hypothetical protein SLEP1_g57956 [Rubroshorea leprosula]|uniref:Endonuclease/exonuclease/phosphatase domain-containing protein n=1 Tax=Rubroshorea leprosula TaxID=152421 RepID=A0AAV5MR20_9ROSI|nr:hypothetical protein SLEP1_g57956 [Rubroshorea leprosula]
MGKRHRKIEECYPKELAEIWAERGQLVTARTKLRQGRREMARKAATETVKRVGSMSLSDGCIMHKNQVIQRELNLHEVRKMMRVGKRLGIEMQGNEEEVESRGLGGPLKKKEVGKLNDRRKKFELWEELRTLILEKGGRGLIAGDFNAVRCLEEKRGRIGENPEMSDFNAFIETTGLIDIRLANRWFTWYRSESDGSSMSRLDRVLMTEEMFTMVDWGPKPFRVLDAWQQHPDLKKTVEDKWNELEVDGFVGYRCKQKLKLLKVFVKGWNQEVFGDMEVLWVQVLHWWGIEVVLSNTIEGVAEFFLHGLGKIIGKEMGACIFLAVSWYLWYCRNMGVFKHLVSFRERVVDMVQAKTFFWIKTKMQRCVFSLAEW